MKINSLIALGIGCILIFIMVGLSHTYAVNHPGSNHQLIAYNKVLKCGQRAFRMGDYSKATELFRKAIATKPNSDRAWIFYKQSVFHELAEQGMIKPELLESRDYRGKYRSKVEPSKLLPAEEDFPGDEHDGC